MKRDLYAGIFAVVAGLLALLAGVYGFLQGQWQGSIRSTGAFGQVNAALFGLLGLVIIMYGIWLLFRKT